VRRLQVNRSLAKWLVPSLFLIGLLGASAHAQISPGPLARAHKQLDSAAHCTDCHKLGGGQPQFKCLECHTEIATRVAAKRGLHGSYGLQAGSSQGCVRCHSDHNGLDFQLIKFVEVPNIKWDINNFDHKKTGWPLEGKHIGPACNKCHTPERIAPAEKTNIKYKDLTRTYLGVPTACVACHQDVHAGRLGQNCLQCHNYTDWKDIAAKFDHSKTRYPLTGLHKDVKCEKCHTPGPDNKPRYTGIPFGKCNDCHADPHKGSFAQQACTACHNTNSWKRVSQSGLSTNFDHSKTKYPLVGKHQTVECVACHLNGDFKKELPFAKCMDCHKDEHQGQFAKRQDRGECASCHNLDGWKPSLFDVKAHQKSAYPLEGGHAKLECMQCHIPKGKETVYKLKFALCMDCHKDDHNRQFAGEPYQNHCEKCHTLNGYSPSTFTLAKHKESSFPLTGSHAAVPCNDCHKLGDPKRPKSEIPYHFQGLSCETCHQDPHNGQFKDRMRTVAANGKPAGCEVCHSTKTWKDLDRFDHSKTSFALVGAHRAVACIDCHKPPNMETSMKNVDFKVAPEKCEQCHEDAHGKQFAKNDITLCADCHNSTKWKPSTFDHDTRTAFSLQGEHRNVKCEGCHKLFKPVDGKQVLFYKPCPKECSACHGPEELKKTNKASSTGIRWWQTMNSGL
jgi:hypothetical protein